jgi:hypothetical protein
LQPCRSDAIARTQEQTNAVTTPIPETERYQRAVARLGEVLTVWPRQGSERFDSGGRLDREVD